MKIKSFSASKDFLADILERYNCDGLVVFRDNKTTVKVFYDLHLRGTIENSLLLAANNIQESYVYFVVNKHNFDEHTIGIIKHATLIYE